MSAARSTLACLAAALVVALAAHGGALGLGFLSDDYEMIRAALEARGPLDALTLRSPWDRSWFRPLAVASFWLQERLAGPDPSGFHAFNLAAHVAVATLAGLLVGSVSRRPAAAVATSALFAGHPLHPEAVAWVSGRFDLLAAPAMLAALLAWLPFARGGRARALAAALSCVLVALASKETAAMAPVWVAGVTLLARLGVTRRVVLGWLAVAALTAVWLLVRHAALSAAGGGSLPSDPSFGARFEPGRIPRYEAQALLAALLPSTGRTSAELLAPAPIAFALAALTWLALAARAREQRAALVAAAGFLALFAVVLLPHAAFGTRLGADLQGARYVYLASSCACAAYGLSFAGAAAAKSPIARAAAILALVVAVGAEVVATRAVVARWREADRLARRVVATFPACEDLGPTVRIAGLPDHVEGAYVFRNAFAEALALERGCAIAVVLDREGAELRFDRALERWVESPRPADPR